MEPLNRYWLSFVCGADDFRPLNYPPNQRVLGWWCSGEDAAGRATLCAVVESESPERCEEYIRADWPEFDGEWRIEPKEKPNNWKPGDRFPLSKWMKKRMK